MVGVKTTKVTSKANRHRTTKVVNIFRNENSIFSEKLKQHRHDKNFFISITEKAGIYDTSGNLEPSYKR